MRKRDKKWQTIIWREWRNCEDEEYANRLFNLVGVIWWHDEPPDLDVDFWGVMDAWTEIGLTT